MFITLDEARTALLIAFTLKILFPPISVQRKKISPQFTGSSYTHASAIIFAPFHNLQVKSPSSTDFSQKSFQLSTLPINPQVTLSLNLLHSLRASHRRHPSVICVSFSFLFGKSHYPFLIEFFYNSGLKDTIEL